MFCSSCGAKTHDAAKFCGHCGAACDDRVASSTSASSPVPPPTVTVNQPKSGAAGISMVIALVAVGGLAFVTNPTMQDYQGFVREQMVDRARREGDKGAEILASLLGGFASGLVASQTGRGDYLLFSRYDTSVGNEHLVSIGAFRHFVLLQAPDSLAKMVSSSTSGNGASPVGFAQPSRASAPTQADEARGRQRQVLLTAATTPSETLSTTEWFYVWLDNSARLVVTDSDVQVTSARATPSRVTYADLTDCTIEDIGYVALKIWSKTEVVPSVFTLSVVGPVFGDQDPWRKQASDVRATILGAWDRWRARHADLLK